MTYPITDEIKVTTAPHTFSVSTGIDLTDADSVHIWWHDPSHVGHFVTGSKTEEPEDGIIEWTDFKAFWTDGLGYWRAEAYVKFGDEFLVGDVWVTPVIGLLAGT